jgi:nucleoside-triphosphatase THEP1
MEHKAMRFQRRVLEVLDEDCPVLGVIKRMSGEFLQSVAGHPMVRALEVTEENRGEVLELLIKEFGYLVASH